MSIADIYKKLFDVFHDVFNDDRIVISQETTAADVRGWDSLSNIRLILAVESTFRIRLSAAQVASLARLGDLVSIIEGKVGSKLA